MKIILQVQIIALTGATILQWILRDIKKILTVVIRWSNENIYIYQTGRFSLLWPGQQPYLIIFSISQSQPHKVCYGLDSNHTYSYSQSASHSLTRFAMAWTATILTLILNQPVTATQGLLCPGQQPYLLLFSISQSQPHKVCYGLDSNHTYSYSQSASHGHTRRSVSFFCL